MLVTNSLIHRPFPTFLESPSQVSKESKKLLRLVELNAALGNRSSALQARAAQRLYDAAVTVVSEQLKALSETSPEKINLNEAKLSLKTTLERELGERYLPYLKDILYDLDDAQDVAKIIKCFHRLLKDKNAIPSSPVKKSDKGVNGPTLLVNHAHPSGYKSYVIKWTKWNELYSNHIFGVFSRDILEDFQKVSFLAPQASGFDSFEALYERPDGVRSSMPIEMSEQIIDRLVSIAQISSSSKTYDAGFVLFSERINGENLSDFVLTKYGRLSSPQKEALFQRIAELGMLDLLLGNMDRFIQIEFGSNEEIGSQEEDTYHLETFEANLGNCIVFCPPDPESPHATPLLYAIDNGIDPRLIEDIEHREAYLVFLNGLFTDPEKMEDLLVENLINSCSRAIATCREHEAPAFPVKDLESKITIFQEEVRTLGREPFRRGLQTMRAQLKESIIPRSQAPESELRQYLLKNEQEMMLEAILERFALFTNRL